MSCIVGLVSGNNVWIGGDSAAVNPETGSLEIERQPKVFHIGPFLFGVSGSPAAQQSIRYSSWIANAKPSKASPEKWVGEALLPHLKYLAKDQRFEALVGLYGHLFHIYDGLQFSEELIGFDACGSGAQVARGCMYYGWPLTNLPVNAEEGFLVTALLAAERFCSGVRGPFTILSI